MIHFFFWLKSRRLRLGLVCAAYLLIRDMDSLALQAQAAGGDRQAAGEQPQAAGEHIPGCWRTPPGCWRRTPGDEYREA